jgi:hypothetical protein
MKTLLALVLVHSFYASDCCGGKDCRPVECDTIFSEAGGGWIWSPSPMTAVHFARAAQRPSPDGRCHVCVTDVPLLPSGTCIYLPPRV